MDNTIGTIFFSKYGVSSTFSVSPCCKFFPFKIHSASGSFQTKKTDFFFSKNDPCLTRTHMGIRGLCINFEKLKWGVIISCCFHIFIRIRGCFFRAGHISGNP